MARRQKMRFVGGLLLTLLQLVTSGDEARHGGAGRRVLDHHQGRPAEDVAVDPHDDVLCAATTLYAFIGDSIPLWDLWREYFRSCDDDAVIRVAAQHHGIRMHYATVEVMFDQVAALRDSFAPNGCAARWIHFVSTSCAPIAPCEEMRGRLRRHQGQSWIQNVLNYSYSSQWITLWAPHALALERERDAIKAFWTAVPFAPGGGYALPWSSDPVTYGSLDELVFVHEAHSRGMPLTNRTLTYFSFSTHIVQDGVTYEPEHPPDYDAGHPATWTSNDPTKLAPFLREALRWRNVFLRKIRPGAAPFFLQHLRNFSGYPTDAYIDFY